MTSQTNKSADWPHNFHKTARTFPCNLELDVSTCEGRVVNKIEQVSTDDHKMSVAGERGKKVLVSGRGRGRG